MLVAPEKVSIQSDEEVQRRSSMTTGPTTTTTADVPKKKGSTKKSASVKATPATAATNNVHATADRRKKPEPTAAAAEEQENFDGFGNDDAGRWLILAALCVVSRCVHVCQTYVGTHVIGGLWRHSHTANAPDTLTRSCGSVRCGRVCQHMMVTHSASYSGLWCQRTSVRCVNRYMLYSMVWSVHIMHVCTSTRCPDLY